MPNFIMGKVVVTKNGSTTICSMSGSINRQVGISTMTNSCSNGYEEVEPGIRRASGNIRISPKYNNIPFINEGDSITLIVENPGGRDYSIPAIVESVNESWSVEGEYQIETGWRSSGAYTVSA